MGKEGGFFDRKLLLCEDMTVTDSSKASTNEIDMGVADANMGAGTPLDVIFVITEAFTGGTSLTFELQHSAAGSSYATIVQTPAIAEASLTLGKVIKLRVPDEHYRFLQGYFTTSGTHSKGKITAYLQPRM